MWEQLLEKTVFCLRRSVLALSYFPRLDSHFIIFGRKSSYFVVWGCGHFLVALKMFSSLILLLLCVCVCVCVYVYVCVFLRREKDILAGIISSGHAYCIIPKCTHAFLRCKRENKIYNGDVELSDTLSLFTNDLHEEKTLMGQKGCSDSLSIQKLVNFVTVKAILRKLSLTGFGYWISRLLCQKQFYF